MRDIRIQIDPQDPGDNRTAAITVHGLNPSDFGNVLGASAVLRGTFLDTDYASMANALRMASELFESRARERSSQRPRLDAMAQVGRAIVDTYLPTVPTATPERPKGFDEQSAQDQQARGSELRDVVDAEGNPGDVVIGRVLADCGGRLPTRPSVLDAIDFGDDDLPRPGKVWVDPNNTD